MHVLYALFISNFHLVVQETRLYGSLLDAPSRPVANHTSFSVFFLQEIDPSVLDKDEIEAKELQPEGTASTWVALSYF